MSFLANRNVQIFNSTMSVSTLNTSAMAISTLTGSTLNASSINVSTLSGSTLNASTMTGNQITISTLTVSSINNGTPGVFSTLNVSSLNTSSITTSSIITAPGYNSNIGNVLYTSLADSGQTAANLTTASMPATVPAGNVISGSYRLTAGASSGAAVMWLGSYAYTPGTTYNFTFTGTQGSQALVLYVYQYNTAGTNKVQISSNVYSITTSAATVSGSFTANLYPATFTGSIVFYFQAAAVNQYVNFTAFSMTTGTMNVGIGTASPAASLDVNGTIISRSQNPAIAFLGDIDGAKWTQKLGGYNFSFGSDSGSFTGFESGIIYGRTYQYGVQMTSTGGMNIKGSVGIGKTMPASNLDITGTFAINNGVAATTTGQFQGIQMSYVGTGATGYANIMATNPGSTYNPIGLNVSGGSVGIGVTNSDYGYTTTIPNAKLTIRGGTPGQENGKSRISIGADNSHYSAIEGAHTTGGATTLAFMTCTNAATNSANPETRMFINSNGNVGIGTLIPNASLQVNGTIMGSRMYSVSGSLTVGTSATNVFTPNSQSGFIHIYWGNGNALYFFQSVSGLVSAYLNQILYNSNNGTVTLSWATGVAITATSNVSQTVYYVISYNT